MHAGNVDGVYDVDRVHTSFTHTLVYLVLVAQCLHVHTVDIAHTVHSVYLDVFDV